MRLFIAIPLPDKVKQNLQKLQEPIRGIRWQAPEQFHLTLRFIGDVNKQVAEAIHQQLVSIHFTPFDLELNGLGYFPSRGRPRVLWAGVEKVSSLMKLQQEVEKACQVAGVEAEDREYKPHITLGKVKGASGQELMAFINQHKQFGTDPVPVREFILYSSLLRSDGAVHTPEERYLLLDDE